MSTWDTVVSVYTYDIYRMLRFFVQQLIIHGSIFFYDEHSIRFECLLPSLIVNPTDYQSSVYCREMSDVTDSPGARITYVQPEKLSL